MDYSDVVAAMFQPTPEGAVSQPTVDASPARRLRDAIEPLAMHAVWSPGTNERLAGLGLNFMTGYVWGRAAAMGEPEPGLVASAFAVFEPGMIMATYEEGRGTCGRSEMLEARTSSTVASLHQVLDGVAAQDDVEAMADVLQSAVTEADGTGRPLFSGLRSRPWPSDAVGRLWHGCELAREHRGDSHVGVCVSQGLDPVEMNILTELWVGLPLASYSATRGWSEETLTQTAEGLRAKGLMDGDQLSAEGQQLRTEIEEMTDRLEQSIVDGMGAEAARFTEHLETWSQLCLDAAMFPPDVYKRAAG